jgi:hypothetical protein
MPLQEARHTIGCWKTLQLSWARFWTSMTTEQATWILGASGHLDSPPPSNARPVRVQRQINSLLASEDRSRRSGGSGRCFAQDMMRAPWWTMIAD